jgi:hypothetical protein
VALGLLRALIADLTCDNALHAFLIQSYCSFMFFLNSLSDGVEYHNFFLASCNVIQSLCATFTRFSTICHLSHSVPPNHNVNHIACICKSCHHVPVLIHLVGSKNLILLHTFTLLAVHTASLFLPF